MPDGSLVRATSIEMDPTPDWSQVTPLVERLVQIAAEYGGTFLIASVGSEDPESGVTLEQLRAEIFAPR
jgi:hypothetical protein